MASGSVCKPCQGGVSQTLSKGWFDRIFEQSEEQTRILVKRGKNRGNDLYERNRLRWRARLGTPRERHYVRVAGVAPDVDVVPFTDSLECLRRAVTERVFLVKDGEGNFVEPPRPKSHFFGYKLAGVLEQLESRLPSTAPVSHDRFVSAYEGRKRLRYQRAVEEIRMGYSRPAEEAKLSVFVKFEKTDRTNKADPVPRVISPRDPKYNVRLGRYLKFLEKPLFKAIDEMFGHPTILKGYNAVESACILKEKWDSFQHPVGLGLDASRFDQHVSLDALRWEHGVYLKCFKTLKHKRRLSALLKRQEINRCYGETPDGELRYTVVGTRMSGDMNTSMGNCLIMCCMIKAFCDELGIRASLANNGDDCVMFMEQEDLPRVRERLDGWFKAMGFTMVAEPPAYEMEEIEFCQTRPVFDGIGWIMCRNPHTALVKDSVMLKNWDSDKLFLGWMDAVGTGGLALAGCLPVFQDFYAMYVRSGERRKVPNDLIPWSFRVLKEGVNRVYGDVHPAARASFYFAFDVTPDEQLVLEQEYRNKRIGSQLGSYYPRVALA